MSSLRDGASAGTSLELSFTERLQQVQAIRVLLAGSALLVCLTGLGDDAAYRPQMQLATATYLITVLVGAVFWRQSREHRPTPHALLLSADGLYLVLVIALSGGLASPARYLLILDVVATTLLVSYRSGIRLTLWVCLLMQGAYLIARTRSPMWWRFPTGPDANRELVSFTVALVAIALLTATAGAFNERALRAGRRDLEVLTALGRNLERLVEPVLVAEQLCHALSDGYRMERSFVALIEGDGLRILASRGTSPIACISIGASLRCAMDSDRPLLMRSIPDEDSPGLAAALPDARDVIVLAMRNGDDVVGVVVAEREPSKRAAIGQRVLNALEQMVAHTTLSLQRATLLVELSRLADTDVLTGLHNRGAFDRTLAVEIDRAQRQGSPIGLMIADIDRFKQINDNQGHPVGDAVLRELGSLLREDLRGFDVAARYGGEEFAILMPGCSHSELAQRSERLRLKVKRAVFSAGPVTLSVGAASTPPQSLDGTLLVAAADASLYEAKRTGRDRAVVAGTYGERSDPVTAPAPRRPSDPAEPEVISGSD